MSHKGKPRRAHRQMMPHEAANNIFMAQTAHMLGGAETKMEKKMVGRK